MHDNNSSITRARPPEIEPSGPTLREGVPAAEATRPATYRK
ncbi:hypothetical protein [Streptomyces sioyaensis]